MARVLIVEDDAASAALLERHLQASGYDTAMARSGAAALERFQRGDYGLIVLGPTSATNPRAVLAQLKAILSRVAPEPDHAALTRGDLTIDPVRRRVELGGRTIAVTRFEFDLLHHLVANAGRVFTRHALLRRVWGSHRIVGPRAVDNLIARLRQKLETVPSRPERIVTVWGSGYTFAAVER